MSQFEYGGSGGGGFVAGGSQYGGSAQGSPGTIKKATPHSLRPITVKQLLNATQAHTDAEWMLDNTELNQVTVVAHVVSISTQATNNVYWLDDGTGRIEGRHWNDASNEDDESDRMNGVTDGIYARAFGSIKSFGGKKYLNVTHIRRLKDSHEILFHILEAITVSLMNSRGPPGGAPQQHSAGGPGSVSAYSAQSHNAATNEEYQNLPPLQRRIIEFMLSQTSNDEGIHVAAIARAVGGDPGQINNAIDSLMDDGFIFSTTDESHFKVSG